MPEDLVDDDVKVFFISQSKNIQIKKSFQNEREVGLKKDCLLTTTNRLNKGQ